ncbi:MAG TPA: ion channel, partial [Methanomassiliicoccales archaeon]|nr:ion channel [Methanomassiliicoccales archaeon]
MSEDRSGLEHYYSSSGIYDFFVKLAHGSNYPAMFIMIAFFSIFLIVPLLGGPNKSTTGELESATVFSGLTIMFGLMIFVVYLAMRREADPRLKKAGQGICISISIPIILYSMTILTTLLTGNEVIAVLRATSSMVILVPLLLIVIMLVESVIRQGIVQKGSKVPLGLVLLTIVLIMYTFATVYYVNGLLTWAPASTGGSGPILASVSFEDAMYYSGLIFTTLGSSEIVPVGIGKSVTVFESISGYIVLGFLTA